MELQYWIFYYAIPAGIATYLKDKQATIRSRVLTMHGFVILSALLLVTTGVSLNWNFQVWQLAILGAAVLLSLYLLGLMGLFYAISCLIQEYCILLGAILLVPTSGLLLGSIATSLVFTFPHYVGREDWFSWTRKFLVIFLWGVGSVLLYFWLEQPLLNIAIHIAGGAILIRCGIIYQSSGTDPI